MKVDKFLILFWVFIASCSDSSDDMAVKPYPATSFEVMQSNLLALTDSLKDKPASELSGEELKRLVDLELMQSQFHAGYDRFSQLSGIIDASIAQQSTPLKRLVKVKFLTAIHRFDSALSFAEQIHDELSSVERDKLQTVSYLKSISVARQLNLENLFLQAQSEVVKYPTYQNYFRMANILIAKQRYIEADAMLDKAMTAYTNVSPFIYSYSYFLKGMIHGEYVAPSNDLLAKEYYQTAIAYVPSFVTARVHLAEVFLSEHNPLRALEILGPVESSDDPEVAGLLSEVHGVLGNAGLSASYGQSGASRYEELLEVFPLAFSDHGVEFYLGPGDNLGRARELAILNINNRFTHRSSSLLIDALGAEDACVIIDEKNSNSERYIDLCEK